MCTPTNLAFPMLYVQYAYFWTTPQDVAGCALLYRAAPCHESRHPEHQKRAGLEFAAAAAEQSSAIVKLQIVVNLPVVNVSSVQRARACPV